MYYGLTCESNLAEVCALACSLWQESAEDAYILMLATAFAETNGGHYRDDTRGKYGEGVFQFDPGILEDVRNRMNAKQPRKVIEAYEKFDIKLEELSHSMLRYAPLAEAVLTRFKYYLVPKPMPKWTDYMRVWDYYKVYFNSIHGKTTDEKFRVAYAKALKFAEAYPYKKVMGL